MYNNEYLIVFVYQDISNCNDYVSLCRHSMHCLLKKKIEIDKYKKFEN